jgi:hypothetical protein
MLKFPRPKVELNNDVWLSILDQVCSHALPPSLHSRDDTQIYTVSDMKSLCLTSKLFRNFATPRLYSTARIQSWNPQAFEGFFKNHEIGASVHFQKTSALVVEDEGPPAEPLSNSKSAPVEPNRKHNPNPDDPYYRDATREDEKPFIGPRSNQSRGSIRFHRDVCQWPASRWPSELERAARIERAVQAFTNTERLRSFRCVLITRPFIDRCLPN